MSKRTVLPILLALSTLTACLAPREGLDVTDVGQLEATLLVPSQHATIADAIAAASPGDVISLAPGTYTEDVLLFGGLWLIGAGPDHTVIEGTVHVAAGEAGLASVSITGPGAGNTEACGVFTSENAAVYLSSTYVSGWYGGVCLNPGADAQWDWSTLQANAIFANGFGVLQMSGRADLLNNLVVYNVRSGVFVYDEADRAHVINNTIAGNGPGGEAEDRDAAVSLGSGAGQSVVRNNAITHNQAGVHCAGFSAEIDHNGYWANDADFAGDAEADPTDVFADPEYADLDGGDFSLAGASPFIDAGSSDGAPVVDWANQPRPVGAGHDIGGDESEVDTLPLVITEVMANPLSEATGEFVEILNVGAVSVELEGLLLDDGDRTDVLVAWDVFPTTLAPGERAVVLDSGYAGQYDLSGAAVLLTVADAGLGNGLSTSDPVSLLRASGDVIDAFTAPFNPGNGVSAEWTDDGWEASACPAGHSLGAAPCEVIEPGDVADLVVSEVMANPVGDAINEYVEVFNASTGPVDLAGLLLTDGDSTDVLATFEGTPTVLEAGAYALVVDPDYTRAYDLADGVVLVTTATGKALGNGLAASSDPVTLMDEAGDVIDTFSFPFDPGNGVSVERVDLDGDDVEDNWVASPCGASPGAVNCAG